MKFALCLLGSVGLVLSAAAQDVISTVVGGGPNGIPAVNANLYNPYTEAVDASGNLYVADQQLNRIFKISTAGTLTVVAGNGTAGYSGDGGAAVSAELNGPWGVAVDTATPANVYIGDTSNCLVRKVDQATGIITTVAGLVTVPTTGAPYSTCGYTGNGGPATSAELYGPAGLQLDAHGNIYVAEYYNGVVRKISGGTITLAAGSGGSTTAGNNCGGTSPYGDGGAATAAYLCYPQAVSLDTTVSPANVFVSEANRCDVQEVVGSSGKIYQVAGDFTCGFKDGVVATSGELNDPWQSHVSVSGATTTIEVSDYSNQRVRQFTLTYAGGVPKPGTITTIAGSGDGGFCGDAGPALNACVYPVGLAYDAAGNFYIADYGNDRVRKVLKSDGYISTIAGWGYNGGTQPNYSDPVGLTGVGGTPSLYYPAGVYADPTSGNVYVGGYNGEAVYLWNSASNEISDFAGNGVAGFAGDGDLANGATTELNAPWGIGRDSTNHIYIADYNNCAIRRVSAATGDISTFGGGPSVGCGDNGNGGTAVNAQFNGPSGVAVNAAGDIFVSEYGSCTIRKIAAGSEIVSIIAGGPALGCGYSGDGGPASAAQVRNVQSIAVDGAGNIYIADYNNYRIREIVAATGIIQTIAGNGNGGYTGDGPAIAEDLNAPTGVTADANGNVFISDTNNQILRWITPTGQLITFAGTPDSAGFAGDGGPALSAKFSSPQNITQDSAGNFYTADYYNFRIRKVTPFAGFGLSTARVEFDTQPAGTTGDFQPITVSAVGPTTISAVSVGAGFTEVDDCAGTTLTAGETCEIDAYFSPTKAGKITGTLTIASNAFFPSQLSSVTLSGTGSGLAISGSLTFGTVLLGAKASSTVTLTNSGAAVTLDKIYMTDTADYSITGGTCPTGAGALAASGSCTITVTFSPKTINGRKGTLVVESSDPASPLLTAAYGTGTEVELSSTTLAFPTTTVGTKEALNLTVTNTGTTTLTISAQTIGGTGAADFFISTTADTCSSPVAAGASCVIPVRFLASTAGSYTASLTLTTNGGSSPVVALSGTATAATTITTSPTSLAYGTITHGTTKTLDLTVSNSGTSTVTFTTAFTGSGSGKFSVLSTGNTCTSGVTAGHSCTLPVQFAPSGVESYSATLTLTTDGANNPAVPLSGTGD